MKFDTLKHTVYITDDLFEESPVFFSEFQNTYAKSLNLFFRKEDKLDFEICVKKVSSELLLSQNISKEKDVVLCLLSSTQWNDKIIFIPFMKQGVQPQRTEFSRFNAFLIPSSKEHDYSTHIHDLTFTILSRLGIDHFHRKVFISYRRAEREAVALDLFESLAKEKSGFEVFIDTRKLDVGVDFMEEIRQVISATDVFLLVYSPTYMIKPFTQKEFYTALIAATGVILLYGGKEKEYVADKNCPKGLPTLFYDPIEETGCIPQNKISELVAMMNRERKNFKNRKMHRFLRVTNNLQMNSLYSFINKVDNKSEVEYVYPLYNLPSSFDLQRIESYTVNNNNGKHIVIYDHWSVPEFYNSNLKWIMRDKNIILKTLQECFAKQRHFDIENMTNTANKPIIFLSASFPSGHNTQDYNFAFIHEIIVTLVEEIMNRNGSLVLGGHPTITPIVANMMNIYCQQNKSRYPDITLFQSSYFEKAFIPEITEFPKERVEIIEKVAGDKEKSLDKMREKMLERHNNQVFTHGIFIGGVIKEDGTCGVWTECEKFHSKYPNAKCIAFDNTGTDLKKIEEIAKENFISPKSIDEFVQLF